MNTKFLSIFLLIISLTACELKDDNKIITTASSIDYKSLRSEKNLNIDSLYSKTKQHIDDTIKVDNLISIYRLSIRNRPIRTDILDDAYSIARKLNYNNGIATTLDRKGINARYAHEYIKAVRLHKEAIPYYEKSGNINSRIKNLNSLGVAYRRLNIEDEAIKYYFEALRLAEKIEHTKSTAIALNGIGNAKINLKKYDESIKYFKLALNLEKLNNNLKGMGYDYSNLGEVFMYKEMYDSSYFYHQKSLKIAKKINYKDNEAIIYNTLGQMFQHKGEYNRSIEYFEKAIPILEKYNSKRYLSNSKINLGINQKYLGLYNKAELNISEGLKIAKKISSKENIILGSKELSNLFQLTGDFQKSLLEHKLMTTYRDSMFNIQSENSVMATEIKYESEKKDEKIKRLNLESKVQKGKIVIQFMTIGLLFILIVFFIIYTRMRTKNRNLEMKDMRHKIEDYLEQISKYKEKDNENKKEDISEKIKEYGLSDREEEVLSFIAKGMKNQEIADKMFVSLSTIKTHTKNIFEKLDVRNRIEAARKAQVM